jgi:hypothetical protein
MHILVVGDITDAQIERLRELYEQKYSEPLDGKVVRLTHDQAEKIADFYRVSVPLEPTWDKLAILSGVLRGITGEVVDFTELIVVHDKVSLGLLHNTRMPRGFTIIPAHKDIFIDDQGGAYMLGSDSHSSPAKTTYEPLGQV